MSIAKSRHREFPAPGSCAAEIYNRSKCNLFDAFIGHPTVYYHSKRSKIVEKLQI